MSDWEKAPKVITWIKKLKDNGCTIHRIEPLALYNKPNGELLFALIKADISDPDNKSLMPIIFLRGNVCIIIPMIINEKNGEKRLVMIKQRRIATGNICLEFPAGMIDLQIDNPIAVALKELYEETGITIHNSSLFPLTETPLYSSPGASDEAIYFFGTIIKLSDNNYNALEGRICGADANEYIEPVPFSFISEIVQFL